MNNEKIENLFNMAMETEEAVREQSLELNVGYDEKEKSWEVIVKFFGTKEALEEAFRQIFPEEEGEIGMTELIGNYGILKVPERWVNRVALMPEIEYMEKPKRLFFAVDNGKSASCVNRLQRENGAGNLTGQGILVAVIDSGIDYTHPDFRKEDGTTRIRSLWDQTLGMVYDRETINRALEASTAAQREAICPSRDLSGHGTHVAGIAAGNGRASNGQYRGIAYESELLVVKLGTPGENGFPRTTELMKALDFCAKKSREYEMPMVVNLSFGNNYGSHSGVSLLETYINEIADYGRIVIAVGSGNEGAAALHTAGVLVQGEAKEVELAVSEFETTLNLQLWKNYADIVEIVLIAPDGSRLGPVLPGNGTRRFRLGRTELLLYYGEPKPYNLYQEIYVEFLPETQYIDSGIWRIVLFAREIVKGDFDMWLPAGGVINQGTAFLYPVADTTLTIPSTAAKAIGVGAYDAAFNQPAAFSGRGYTRETNQIKPDIVAPGVNIISCAPGGGYLSRTGTSMATPFVSGGAALLMEWGIVRGNDPYLYGEKVKAYFIKGAKRDISGVTTWPDPQLGWGALCVSESIPR